MRFTLLTPAGLLPVNEVEFPLFQDFNGLGALRLHNRMKIADL